VLENDYEAAVKIFLTEYTKFEKSAIKKEKKLILENWNSMDKVNAKTKFLKQIIDEYKKTKDWQKAYSRIPKQLRIMFEYAYESYLWNEHAKELIKKAAKKFQPVKYNIGTLFFFDELDISKVPESIPAGKNQRQLVIKLSDFAMSEPKEDELNKGKYKLVLKFSLPKGSYATIITKKLFNK
jgi:tRNA pseudouridine13 synthase